MLSFDSSQSIITIMIFRAKFDINFYVRIEMIQNLYQKQPGSKISKFWIEKVVMQVNAN